MKWKRYVLGVLAACLLLAAGLALFLFFSVTPPAYTLYINPNPFVKLSMDEKHMVTDVALMNKTALNEYATYSYEAKTAEQVLGEMLVQASEDGIIEDSIYVDVLREEGKVDQSFQAELENHLNAALADYGIVVMVRSGEEASKTLLQSQTAEQTYETEATEAAAEESEAAEETAADNSLDDETQGSAEETEAETDAVMQEATRGAETQATRRIGGTSQTAAATQTTAAAGTTEETLEADAVTASSSQEETTRPQETADSSETMPSEGEASEEGTQEEQVIVELVEGDPGWESQGPHEDTQPETEATEPVGPGI